jgi:predicted O-methyltransferase YrrM
MRSFRHWTPRYLFNRTIEKSYRSRNPGLPWLTPAANEILQTYLLPSDVGLEFGSGGSTLWFARRVKSLTSVEHNPDWYDRVHTRLETGKITNVDYHLHPGQETPGMDGSLPAYVLEAEKYAENSLDFVLVDGIYRDLCALTSLSRLKPGGVLLIDNVNLHLPCRSYAPNSRSPEDGPATAQWAKFQNLTQGWRKIWTSNGVSDTAFFFRLLS